MFRNRKSLAQLKNKLDMATQWEEDDIFPENIINDDSRWAPSAADPEMKSAAPTEGDPATPDEPVKLT